MHPHCLPTILGQMIDLGADDARIHNLIMGARPFDVDEMSESLERRNRSVSS